MLCCALMACKKVTVDFTYEPTAPKAGESVTFYNHSSSGEEWSWNFGDGAVSTIKSPSHTYKQPGTYRITLKVDDKSSLTATKEITVYDTIPSFTVSDSTFVIYKDYTFTASVYNPFNYEVKYLWYRPAQETIEEYAQITDTVLTNSTLHLYFTRPMSAASIGLRVILNGDTTYIQKEYEVQNRFTNSVYFRTPKYDFQQRIYEEKSAPLQQLADRAAILDYEQDTFQTYSGYDFTLSELAEVFPGLEGFHICSRKIYFRANGLWVANIDGAYLVQIDSLACSAMSLDTKDNRIYWANENGVWYMPFIGSDNNKFITTPVLLNDLVGVSKLAADCAQ